MDLCVLIHAFSLCLLYNSVNYGVVYTNHVMICIDHTVVCTDHVGIFGIDQVVSKFIYIASYVSLYLYMISKYALYDCRITRNVG